MNSKHQIINYIDFKKNGYVVVKNVLTESEIKEFRKTLDHYLNHNASLRINDAKIIPGWSGITPELGVLNTLHEDQRIISRVSEIFNFQDFRFVGHSDLHQNKYSGWHRDIKDMERGGCNLNIWNDDCFIIKVCFLLQDHIDNDLGLWFKPESHISPSASGKSDHVYSSSLDMIIFDQRIIHKGQDKRPYYLEKYNQNRYLLTFGYGLNNAYSDFHEKGAMSRQLAQRKRMV